MAQEYDLLLKVLAERFPRHFVQLVRGIPVGSAHRKEKEAVATRRDSDQLFQVSEDGYEYLMAIEIQASPDPDMPRRLLEYTALQHREFGKPVYPVVVNLTGGQQESAYGFSCLELTVVAFQYRVMNLPDVPGQELLERGPLGIIPLVPLMRHEEPAEVVLEKCARRIEEAPVEWQPDLYLGLAVLSSLRLAKEIVRRVIEMSKVQASPFFDGIREEWIDQGKLDVAKRLLLLGVDIDIIVKATGLTQAELENLKKELTQ